MTQQIKKSTVEKAVSKVSELSLRSIHGGHEVIDKTGAVYVVFTTTSGSHSNSERLIITERRYGGIAVCAEECGILGSFLLELARLLKEGE